MRSERTGEQLAKTKIHVRPNGSRYVEPAKVLSSQNGRAALKAISRLFHDENGKQSTSDGNSCRDSSVA